MAYELKHTDRNHLPHHFKTIAGNPPVEWKVSHKLVEYPEALRYMQERVENILAKTRMNKSGFLNILPFIQLVQVQIKRSFSTSLISCL